jgi:hypothetical protein
LQRSRDGSLNRDQNYRFEIHNDVGWDAAAERYADACRAVLSLDPFTAGAPTNPRHRGKAADGPARSSTSQAADTGGAKPEPSAAVSITAG